MLEPFSAKPFQLTHQSGMLFLAPTPWPSARLTQKELIGIGPRTFEVRTEEEPAEAASGGAGSSFGGLGIESLDGGSDGAGDHQTLPPLETVKQQ